MFDRLGRLVGAWWPLWLIAWGAALAAVWVFAPPWENVVDPRNTDFLPANSASRIGTDVFDRAFPGQSAASSVVFVVYRDRGKLTDADRQFVDDILATKLEAVDVKPSPSAGGGKSDESAIGRIRTASSAGMSALLDSTDGQATLVVADLRADYMSYDVVPIVRKFENEVLDLEQNHQVPAGLQIAVTGSAVVGRDIKVAQQQSASNTSFWTVALVIILLLVVYQAPFVVLAPLVTLSIAFKVCLGLVALFAWWAGLSLFEGLDVYGMVVAYGVGVDYTLFLISRHREELQKQAEPRGALVTSLSRAGVAIAASAGTGILGIGMMSFASFGKLRQAGLTISFSLLIMLCAALTLTAALLMLGRCWIFWPQSLSSACKPGERPRIGIFDRFWHWVGAIVTRRPATVWLVTVVLMLPFVVGAVVNYNHLDYGLIDDLPDYAASVVGTKIVRAHFPAGDTGAVTIVWQDPKIDFRSPEGFDRVSDLTEKLMDDKQNLEIADIRSLSQPLGSGEPANAAATDLFTRATTRAAVRQRATAHYVGEGDEGKHVTRMDVVLAVDPFTRQSISVLDRLQKVIRDDLSASAADSVVYPIGATASMRDLKIVAAHDRTLINILVVAAVFVVLLLLGLGVGLSIYLVLTVVFSYLASLGVTFAVFWAWRGSDFPGLDWMVPLFLFTILVAVGIDYNIFLVSRIREEEAEYGPVRGIAEALGRTGMIISSCGIIMAGTFASLLIGGRLGEMVELGFALPFGILLDTFIVRPLLVPSFMALCETGRLGAVGRAFSRGKLRQMTDGQPTQPGFGARQPMGSG